MYFFHFENMSSTQFKASLILSFYVLEDKSDGRVVLLVVVVFFFLGTGEYR